MNSNKQIILFDGVCNLCNTTVQYIIKKDKKDVFRFAALQSEIGQKLLKERNIDSEIVDSIVLIKPNVAYYLKATAALEICQQFGGVWKLTAIFNVFPEGFRNIVYDYIAKNRYRWYGKKDQCMIPNKEILGKFLLN